MPTIPDADGGRSTPTYEQVDQHVRSIDPVLFAEPRALPDPAAAIGRIKAVYQAARPVLQVVATVAVLPPRWRAVMDGFLRAMDALVAVV